MKYWRMQLHPDRSGRSAYHSASSLAAGFIGLDFRSDVGDLKSVTRVADVPEGQRDYLAFANSMDVGDRVLIISHHFPLAVCEVKGEYNYIRQPESELGVWFRHFRRVHNVKYYADFKTNAKAWEKIIMTDTISPLVNDNTASIKLIKAMYGDD